MRWSRARSFRLRRTSANWLRSRWTLFLNSPFLRWPTRPPWWKLRLRPPITLPVQTLQALLICPPPISSWSLMGKWMKCPSLRGLVCLGRICRAASSVRSSLPTPMSRLGWLTIPQITMYLYLTIPVVPLSIRSTRDRMGPYLIRMTLSPVWPWRCTAI